MVRFRRVRRMKTFVSVLVAFGLGSAAFGAQAAVVPAAVPAVVPGSTPPPITPNAGLERDVLAQVLQSSEAVTPAYQQKVAGLLEAYRMGPVPNTPTIAGAPFVGYVFENQILPGYAATYDSQYADAYKNNVTNLTLEGIFDLFLDEVINGGLTGDLAKAGKQIGVCMAKKVERAKGSSCALDSSDRPEKKPSLIELGIMKYTCDVPFFRRATTPCEVRKAIFAVSKPTIIKARNEGLISKAFVAAYPTLFRSTLINGVNDDRTGIGQLVSSKFKSTYNSKIWAQAPLIDLDNPNGQATLHAFATGLRVDIRAASLFDTSTDPQLKALAGPLFYAAANRLLVLMGGTETKWDGTKFVEAPGDAFDPKNPKKSPSFVTERFGGITATSLAGHEVSSTIDIANYDPTLAKNPSPLQIFPSTFTLGQNGIPNLQNNPSGSVETLSDLADLMGALTDFLELSTAASSLSPHFASGADLTRIVDKDDPALFPKEGRALAAGLIAAALKNMLAPQGHLELPSALGSQASGADDPDHTGAFGIKFFDRVGLNGRLPGKVPTDALSRLFFEAARFSDLIGTNDPDLPAQLSTLRGDLDEGVQIWLLSVLSKVQNPDGGISEVFGAKESVGRSLLTQLDTLKSLTIGYKAGGSGVVRQTIHDTWVFLDRYFANGQWLDVEPVGGMAAQSTSPAASKLALWAALNLWDHTITSPVYKDLMDPKNDPAWASSHGWDKWQTRFDALRNQLQNQ
jgi:hypothetical protein